jgi:hypothetical protein
MRMPRGFFTEDKSAEQSGLRTPDQFVLCVTAVLGIEGAAQSIQIRPPFLDASNA